ncbi:hypothetical protein J6590_063537 [Homalodisca vitripennis]|nr:hypothetical protein J6590_063537 [Homalodisca vitripennis]
MQFPIRRRPTENSCTEQSRRFVTDPLMGMRITDSRCQDRAGLSGRTLDVDTAWGTVGQDQTQDPSQTSLLVTPPLVGSDCREQITLQEARP